MTDYLNTLDTQVFTAINAWHMGYADHFMWLVSSRLSWTLLLAALLWMLWRKGWRQAVLVVAALGVAVLLADQVSSGIIKHAVERLRPSHNLSLAATIHLVRGYQGGLYGFVSSHAANSMAVCLLLSLMLRDARAWWALLLWTALQCYSRIYLGVHYPGDILGGLLVGMVVAFAIYPVWKRLSERWRNPNERLFDSQDAALMAWAVVLTVLVIAVLAVFL